jgi:hypothetical protein
MSLVLAVEPDAKQAETVRRILGQEDGPELIVVTSAYAATSMMKRRAPDVVLLGASLGSKAQEVIDIFSLVSAAANPQTLRIPPLRAPHTSSWGARTQPRQLQGAVDPEVFAAEVAACLARAAEQRQRQNQPHASPPATDAHRPLPEEPRVDPPIAESNPEPVFDAVPSDVQAHASGDAQTGGGSALRHSILINLDSATSGENPIDPEIHAAHVAFVQARAEARLASELERVRREADAQRAAELARLEEEAEARRRADVARLQEEAEARRRSEVAEARAAAAAEARDVLSAELAAIRNDAEATLAAELARVRAETERRLAEQLEEADRARATAVEGARVAAEQAAAQALQAEIARINAANDARHAAELRRVHEEAEGARQAQEQALQHLESVRDAAAQEARAAAEEAGARALADEVARARQEADACLAAELARARADAEAARRAQEQAHFDLEGIREAAAQEGRAAREAAIRALQEEVDRVRAEADDRLQRELARLREETEQVREAHEQAQLEATFAREAAVRQAVAAAEAAAGHFREIEIASVQADAEARLNAQLLVPRDDAPVAAIPREQARGEAAAPATFRQIIRGAAMFASAARVAAQIGGRTAVAAFRGVRVLARQLLRGARATLPVLRATWERLPARTVPAAAVVLLVALAGLLVDLSSLATAVRSSAGWASGTAATVLSRARQAVEAPASSTAAAGAPPAEARNEPPPDPIDAAAGTAGMLAVFSRVPLDLYVSDRRIGTTEDGQILLPPGRYRVRLVNTRLKYRGEVTLVVRSAQVTAHTVRLPDGHVQVNTEPGAEVWIEGKRAGVAPLGALPVPLGSREIVVRHPDLGERREFIDVRYGEIAEVSIRPREGPGSGARGQESAERLTPAP